jgi:hypothetical protein
LVDDVSDEQSLLQMPFEANCMNWILGHIISRRQSALEALQSTPLWGAQEQSRYKTGSNPIRHADQAIDFTTLRAELGRSLEMLRTTLLESDSEILNRVVVNDRGEKTVAEHIEGFLWHETYHLGQLEILRSFIQSDDQVG